MSLAVAGAWHLQALLGSLGRLARSPLSTTLTLLVIALALALPTSLWLLVTNAQLATGNFANAVDVSVYLKTDVPLAKAQQLAQAAGQRADVAAVTVIAADKGLEDFLTYSGFGEALQALKENPLPHVLHVRPRAEDSSPAALESLRRYFSAWPEVDLVQRLERSEEHTSELQSQSNLVCRLLLEKKKKANTAIQRKHILSLTTRPASS